MDGLQEYIDKRLVEDENIAPTLDDLNKYTDEFMQEYNTRPFEHFERYSRLEMHEIIYELFSPKCSIQIAEHTTEVCKDIHLFRQVKLLLKTISKEKSLKLTPKGNLPVRIVKELYYIGAPEYIIEKDIAKLRTEDDSVSVRMSHIAVDLMHAVKKRNNSLSLTKSGAVLLTDDNRLLKELLTAMLSKFNPAYFDNYRSDNIGALGIGFTLILLDKYGDSERTDKFYSDKYFAAFPLLMEEVGKPYYGTLQEEATHCYSLRTFDIILYHLGLVTINETDKHRPTHKKQIYRTEIFTKLFRLIPPQH